MKRIRILLVDDHSLLRAGIRSLLAQRGEFQIVAEASNGAEAIEKIIAHQPDVVLMDIGMTRMNGLETTARAIAELPRLRIIILSLHQNDAYVDRALRLGALGYLLKDSMPTELERAIQTVAKGKIYLGRGISHSVFAKKPSQLSGETRVSAKLTPRQQQIVRLIADGHSNKQIAGLLGLSAKTVEMHRTELMRRLDVHDVISLIRCAVRLGILHPEA